MIGKIQQVLEKRKREKVRKEYLSLIDKNPKDTRSRLKLGDIYSKEGRVEEAVEQYAASAEIFFEAGFHLKSIALYKQILKFRPDSATAIRRVAQISFQYGLFADAYPYYEKMAKAIGAQEGGESILEIFKEIALLPLKETRTKIQIFEAVIPERAGSFSEPYDRLCKIAADLTREDQGFESALILAKWIADYYPDRCEGHEILLPLLKKAGQGEMLQQTLSSLRSLYEAANRLEEKKSFLEPFEDTSVFFSDADLLERQGTGSTTPGDKVKIKMEANVYDLLKKKAAEKRTDEEAPGNEAGSPEGRPQSALDRLEFQDLFSNFKQGIQDQVSKSDSDTQYNLGIAYQEMELYEDAIQQFKIACEENPTIRYDAYFMMGTCARALDRMEEALEHFETALTIEALEPEQVCAIEYEMAITLSTMGEKEKALRMFNDIKGKISDYRDIDTKINELL